MHLDHILRQIDFRKLTPTEQARYIGRIQNIAAVIENRFPHVKKPEQIKLAHAQYFRNVWLPAHSASKSTRREYMRALRLLVMAQGRPESWLGALRIGQKPEKGGRPSKVGVRKSKKS